MPSYSSLTNLKIEVELNVTNDSRYIWPNLLINSFTIGFRPIGWSRACGRDKRAPGEVGQLSIVLSPRRPLIVLYRLLPPAHARISIEREREKTVGGVRPLPWQAGKPLVRRYVCRKVSFVEPLCLPDSRDTEMHHLAQDRRTVRTRRCYYSHAR